SVGLIFARTTLAMVAFWAGDTERARSLLAAIPEDALDHPGEQSPHLLAAFGTHLLSKAFVETRVGNLDDAIRVAEKNYSLACTRGGASVRASAASVLAAALLKRDPARAREFADLSIRLGANSKDSTLGATRLSMAAGMYAANGDYAEA